MLSAIATAMLRVYPDAFLSSFVLPVKLFPECEANVVRFDEREVVDRRCATAWKVTMKPAVPQSTSCFCESPRKSRMANAAF